MRRHDDGPVVTAFLDRLAHNDVAVRSAAVEAVGRIASSRVAIAMSLHGERGNQSWDRVMKALLERRADDPDPSVRQAAGQAIETMASIRDGAEGRLPPVVDRHCAFITLLAVSTEKVGSLVEASDRGLVAEG